MKDQTQNLVREHIPHCLTDTPAKCPREYDASAVGKWLICDDPRHGGKKIV